jgi:hypothetical protein
MLHAKGKPGGVTLGSSCGQKGLAHFVDNYHRKLTLLNVLQLVKTLDCGTSYRRPTMHWGVPEAAQPLGLTRKGSYKVYRLTPSSQTQLQINPTRRSNARNRVSSRIGSNTRSTFNIRMVTSR